MTSKLVVAGLAVAVAALVSPASARAGSHLGVAIFVGHDDHRYGYGYQDTYRLGLNRGYQEGYDHGSHDGEDHDSYDFSQEKRYRNADSGYHSNYGPKCDYQRGYRAGYEAGYRRAYSQAVRYGSSNGHCDQGYARELPRDREWDDDRGAILDDRYRR